MKKTLLLRLFAFGLVPTTILFFLIRALFAAGISDRLIAYSLAVFFALLIYCVIILTKIGYFDHTNSYTTIKKRVCQQFSFQIYIVRALGCILFLRFSAEVMHPTTKIMSHFHTPGFKCDIAYTTTSKLTCLYETIILLRTQGGIGRKYYFCILFIIIVLAGYLLHKKFRDNEAKRSGANL